MQKTRAKRLRPRLKAHLKQNSISTGLVKQGRMWHYERQEPFHSKTSFVSPRGIFTPFFRNRRQWQWQDWAANKARREGRRKKRVTGSRTKVLPKWDRGLLLSWEEEERGIGASAMPAMKMPLAPAIIRWREEREREKTPSHSSSFCALQYLTVAGGTLPHKRIPIQGVYYPINHEAPKKAKKALKRLHMVTLLVGLLFSMCLLPVCDMLVKEAPVECGGRWGERCLLTWRRRRKKKKRASSSKQRRMDGWTGFLREQKRRSTFQGKLESSRCMYRVGACYYCTTVHTNSCTYIPVHYRVT